MLLSSRPRRSRPLCAGLAWWRPRPRCWSRRGRKGENIVVEQLRWGDRSPASLQRLAQDIVRLKLELVIASTDQHVTAARAATPTIPIVMVYAQDPVGQGFIASMARPGGNITGLTWDPGPEIRGKLVELLAECRPGLSRLAPWMGTIRATERPGWLSRPPPEFGA